RGHGKSRPQLDYLGDPFPVAVTVPGRHQGAPTLEQIAAPVAAFDPALDAMPERLLDHLMRKARSLVAPIFETRAKTVRDRRGFVANGLKKLREHALADGIWIDRLAIAEHRRLGIAARGQLSRNGERAAYERHALIAPQILHAGLWDHPHGHRRTQIELGTAC